MLNLMCFYSLNVDRKLGEHFSAGVSIILNKHKFIVRNKSTASVVVSVNLFRNIYFFYYIFNFALLNKYELVPSIIQINNVLYIVIFFS